MHTHTIAFKILIYISSSINFLRLCYIIVEDVPQVLRILFQSQFSGKYKHQWTDTPQSGQLLMSYERWRSKLGTPQIQLLQNGNTKQWDPTLIFHVLLYSSLCLLASKIQGTQFSVQVQSKMVKALVTSVDLRNFLRSGNRIIVDLGSDPFRSVVTKVNRNQFFIRQPFNFPQGYQGQLQAQVIVDVYICEKEWDCVEQLAHLRNNSFGHCSEARTTTKELNSIVQHIEQIYWDLNISQKAINDMKAIKSGKDMDVHTLT